MSTGKTSDFLLLSRGQWDKASRTTNETPVT